MGTSDVGPLVVLMCGIAGAGKTTYAKRLECDGFIRLSIDEEIWRRWGRYDVDYPADRYSDLQRLAEEAVRSDLVTLLEQGRDVVVDLSMWRRSARDQYKALIERAGGRWRLVYLRVSTDLLRRRLTAPSSREDANAAFPVTEVVLDQYLRDFEEPNGEGEEIIMLRSKHHGEPPPERSEPLTSRCELAAPRSLLVIFEVRRGVTAIVGHGWSARLLYFAAVRSAERRFGARFQGRPWPCCTRRRAS